MRVIGKNRSTCAIVNEPGVVCALFFGSSCDGGYTAFQEICVRTNSTPSEEFRLDVFTLLRFIRTSVHPKRGPMFIKKLGKELFFFALTVAVSLLFWFIIASFTDQCVTVKDCVYIREKNAFFATIAFFYFVRLSAWVVRSQSSSS